MIDLGTPGSVSSALGINGRGQVLVYTESGATRRTSLWKDGTVTDLGTLPGRTSAVGQALNDRGQGRRFQLHSGRGVFIQRLCLAGWNHD